MPIQSFLARDAEVASVFEVIAGTEGTAVREKKPLGLSADCDVEMPFSVGVIDIQTDRCSASPSD